MPDDRPVKRARYASQACEYCRKKKIRCSGNHPCTTCSAKRVECLFQENQGRFVTPINRRPSQPHTKESRHAGRVTTDRHNDSNSTSSPSRQSFTGRSEDSPSSPRQIPKRTTAIPPLETDFSKRKEPNFSNSQPAFDAFPVSSYSVKRHFYPFREPPLPPPQSKVSVRVGSESWPFPRPRDYLHYMETFFGDVHHSHPCVNEPEFRRRAVQLSTTQPLLLEDQLCFLALNYTMFALVDILYASSAPGQDHVPGWDWFILAQEVSTSRKVIGSAANDLSLLQLLAFQTLYLTYTEQHNEAYHVSGLASRLCFQLKLHLRNDADQGSLIAASNLDRSTRNFTDYEVHMRQRVFWTIYYVDRRVSQMCGRPHIIRDWDISAELPALLNDSEVHPGRPLPAPDPYNSLMPFLSCVVLFARWSGEIWDKLCSAGASRLSLAEKTEAIESIDGRIAHWSSETLPTIPLVPISRSPTPRQEWQRTLVITRMLTLRMHLRKFLSRSRSSDRIVEAARDTGAELAVAVLRLLKRHQDDAKVTKSIRHHITACVAMAIICLSAVLVVPSDGPPKLSKNLPADKIQKYAGEYQSAVETLYDYSSSMQAAWKIALDLEPTINQVAFVLDPNSLGSSTVNGEREKGIARTPTPLARPPTSSADPLPLQSAELPDDTIFDLPEQTSQQIPHSSTELPSDAINANVLDGDTNQTLGNSFPTDDFDHVSQMLLLPEGYWDFMAAATAL